MEGLAATSRGCACGSRMSGFRDRQEWLLAIDRRMVRADSWCRMEVLMMTSVTLSASPSGNGFQATVSYPSGVSMASAETWPSEAEALAAAARKMLAIPERLHNLGGTKPAT